MSPVSEAMEAQEIAVRLGVAVLFGGLIGFERQWRQRMAGLRTNSLVAIGAAGFVVFSMMASGDNSPTRVAAQVVSGVGFLGAGVILREGINVTGSENLEDSPQVTVSALLVSADRNDSALEQIIGRISLEPFVTAVHCQAARAAAES